MAQEIPCLTFCSSPVADLKFKPPSSCNWVLDGLRGPRKQHCLAALERPGCSGVGGHWCPVCTWAQQASAPCSLHILNVTVWPPGDPELHLPAESMRESWEKGRLFCRKWRVRPGRVGLLEEALCPQGRVDQEPVQKQFLWALILSGVFVDQWLHLALSLIVQERQVFFDFDEGRIIFLCRRADFIFLSRKLVKHNLDWQLHKS